MSCVVTEFNDKCQHDDEFIKRTSLDIIDGEG